MKFADGTTLDLNKPFKFVLTECNDFIYTCNPPENLCTVEWYEWCNKGSPAHHECIYTENDVIANIEYGIWLILEE